MAPLETPVVGLEGHRQAGDHGRCGVDFVRGARGYVVPGVCGRVSRLGGVLGRVDKRVGGVGPNAGIRVGRIVAAPEEGEVCDAEGDE
jgi:hypothetical protein